MIDEFYTRLVKIGALIKLRCLNTARSDAKDLQRDVKQAEDTIVTLLGRLEFAGDETLKPLRTTLSRKMADRLGELNFMLECLIGSL